MTHVVCEPCVGCRFTDCVEVCPVECFHVLADRVVINPDTCIDCTACVPVCPVEAIYADVDLPAQWADFAETNAAGAKQNPVITARVPPLPGAEAKRKK